MNKSESIKAIAEALTKFQGEVANPKNTATNPAFKSKYAPLGEVLNTVRPILAKYGLSVVQSPSSDGQDITVCTLLMHTSGEFIELDPLVLRADKATAQGAGSAITYGRRYTLSAALGISSEDDDDGNGPKQDAKPEQPKQTKPEAPKPAPPPAPPKKQPKPIGAADLDRFIIRAQELEYDKDDLLATASEVLQRDVTDLATLTKKEITAIYTYIENAYKAKKGETA